MNNVEKLFTEQMETEKFFDVINDNFSFIDSLIDKRDMERLGINEEAEVDG